MKLKIVKIVSLFLILSVNYYVKGQEKKSPVADVENVLTIVPTNLCVFDVSVWSSKKGYLKDLTADNFEIFEDKESQKAEVVFQEDEPVSVGILFDLSGSVKSGITGTTNEVPFLLEGLIKFINKSNPKNDYFIVGFANGASVLLESTSDGEKIGNALREIAEIEPKGNTSIYDALALGYEKISSAEHQKKVLLVISDGEDTNSKKNDLGDLKKSVREKNVLVYAVNFLQQNEDRRSLESMFAFQSFEMLTENSGGRVLYPKNRGEIIGSFEMIAEELRSQYKIAIMPDDSNEKEKWRKIKIKVNLPENLQKEAGKIFVRVREGYYR